MKRIVLIFFCFSLFSCSSNEEVADSPEATVIGRWNLSGFVGSVMYEFTADKRYTLYSGNGEFETVQQVIDSGRSGNNWWYEGDKITVDLNFGNTSTLTPVFKCNNNVIEWLTDLGEIHATYFREGYDITSCNE